MSNLQNITRQHSVCTQAFAVTVAELQEQSVAISTEVKEVITLAILELAQAGQRDVEALARYAKSKALKYTLELK